MDGSDFGGGPFGSGGFGGGPHPLAANLSGFLDGASLLISHAENGIKACEAGGAPPAGVYEDLNEARSRLARVSALLLGGAR